MENIEQPNEVLLGLGSEEQNSSEAIEQTSLGSISKFKDVKSLNEAYLNLQSEFTRKCQRLSELEKINNDNLSKSNSDNLNDEKATETIDKPFYENSNWQTEVNNFLKSNPEAHEFASEIVNEVIKDKALANNPNSLQIAYNKILASKYKNKAELLEDEDFVNNYIISNSKIQEKIINNYISKLNSNTPKVITSSHLSSVGLTPLKKPTTLDEARLMAKEMFK